MITRSNMEEVLNMVWLKGEFPRRIESLGSAVITRNHGSPIMVKIGDKDPKPFRELKREDAIATTKYLLKLFIGKMEGK